MPGPPEKVWPETNSIEGVLLHSAVGTLQGVINVVFGPASNQRSVTGVVGKQGRAIQFYSVLQSPWANGNHEVNRRFLGFEHEGGADTPATVSEPLNQSQIDFDIHVLKDLQAFKGADHTFWKRPTSSTDKSASLWEHREMTRFGASATACPSGRIPWPTIIAGLAPPAYAPIEAEPLGEFLRAVTQKKRVVWADQVIRLVEVVDEFGQPMNPRHYFYV